MPKNRTYSEKEIATLLQRSAQLQADDAQAEKSSRAGLSLEELELIASDSGLDPSYLHRAALEMEMSKGKPSMPKKDKTHIYVDRFFSGELTDEMWEEIVFDLRHRYGSTTAEMYGSTIGMGVSEQIGRSREWRVTSMSGVQTSVLFRPYKQGTRVELSQRVGISSPKVESIFYGFSAAIVPAIIAVAATKSIVWGSAAMVGLLAVFIPLVYYLDVAWRNKKLRQLNETGDSLIEMMERLSVEEGPKTSSRDGVSSPDEVKRAAKPVTKKTAAPDPVLTIPAVEEFTNDAASERPRTRE